MRSFDFDGCLFNRNYQMLTEEDRLILANSVFIEKITKEIQSEQFEKVILMVGSNRQSLAIDQANTGTKGSCYPALEKLCKEFQSRVSPITCEIDHYLLADTYGQTPDGENFKKALQQDENYKYSHWLFDDSKLTLLYAQMHKAACDNPNATITFDFYDDRFENDILQKLAVFFDSNKDLVPHNLLLRLHHYDGHKIKDVINIQGEGPIDSNFKEHIHLMIHGAGLSYRKDYANAKNVLSQLLIFGGVEEFKKKRQLSLGTDNRIIYRSSKNPDPNLFYSKNTYRQDDYQPDQACSCTII